MDVLRAFSEVARAKLVLLVTTLLSLLPPLSVAAGACAELELQVMIHLVQSSRTLSAPTPGFFSALPLHERDQQVAATVGGGGEGGGAVRRRSAACFTAAAKSGLVSTLACGQVTTDHEVFLEECEQEERQDFRDLQYERKSEHCKQSALG